MEAKLIKVENTFYLKQGGTILGTSSYPNLSASIRYSLSLENCEAIERGYDLDELAEDFIRDLFGDNKKEIDLSNGIVISFIKGFQKALEILGDKKYSEDDVNLAFVLGKNKDESRINKLINSRLQQTEWDVEIVEEQVYDGLDEMAQPQYYKQPKLDEKNQLILKKKLISS